MKGFLKIEPAEHNGNPSVSINCQLSNVSTLDKAGIISGIMEALDIDIDELAKLIALMELAKEANAVTKIRISLNLDA